MHWTNTHVELIENLLQTWEMWEDGHIATCVRNWSILIDQRLNFEIFNVSNESDVTPCANKAVVITKLGLIIILLMPILVFNNGQL